MPDELKQQPEPKKRGGHRFQPGHPRFGGRKKRDPLKLREMADKLGASHDPIMFCLTLIGSDTVQEVRIGADGKKTRVEVTVTVEMKLEASRIVAGYLYPKLSSTKVSGNPDEPVTVDVAGLDITTLLADPSLTDAAQLLALALAGQGQPAPPALPAPDYWLPR